MRSDEHQVCLDLPYFQGLAQSSVRQLLDGARLERSPIQAGLIQQGGSPDYLHVVVEGRVELFSRHAERETTVDVIGEGDSFILAAVFLDRPYLKSARALTPVRLLLVPSFKVRAVFRHDPAFAERCAADLARGYRRLVKEVGNLKFRSSLERLANWLLLQARRSANRTHFIIPFDKKTLAAKLGIAPEVLSRNFAALGEHGVKISGKSVEVTDFARLERLAMPAPALDDPAY